MVRVTIVPGGESALALSVENLRPLDGNDVMASLSAPLVITCDSVACDSVIHARTHAHTHYDIKRNSRRREATKGEHVYTTRTPRMSDVISHVHHGVFFINIVLYARLKFSVA